MNIFDLIERKKNYQSLTEEEIEYFVEGYTSGEIPDYQASALLMAVCFAGMDSEETLAMTKAMMNSGDIVDLSGIEGVTADKHSTGGIGDKTTLVLIPMLAACGLVIAKMSGRGLGYTGGTIDKLESISGFRTSFTKKEFFDIVKDRNVIIAAQTSSVAPADKKLYALRDVTNTVDNISLIASSIMSKKLACGTENLILDVKTGSGSFMKSLQEAEELAEMMVGIAKGMSKNACAVISDMNQPLGNAVGNALEVAEAVRTLKGDGPEDLLELCTELGANLLVVSGLYAEAEEAKEMLLKMTENGTAFEKFREIVKNQGGDISQLEDTSLLPSCPFRLNVKAPQAGFAEKIDSRQIGMASLMSGAGRQTIDSDIDFGAGIVLHKKLGDYVQAGETIASVYSSDENKLLEAADRVLESYSFSEEAVNRNTLIYKVIR